MQEFILVDNYIIKEKTDYGEEQKQGIIIE